MATPLPGWPVLAALTEALPDGIHLREDAEHVFICSQDRVVATAAAAIPLASLVQLIRLAGVADAARQ